MDDVKGAETSDNWSIITHKVQKAIKDWFNTEGSESLDVYYNTESDIISIGGEFDSMQLAKAVVETLKEPKDINISLNDSAALKDKVG